MDVATLSVAGDCWPDDAPTRLDSPTTLVVAFGAPELRVSELRPAPCPGRLLERARPC